MYAIEEILSPLGAEKLKSLLSSDSGKVRGLSSSFFHIRIPLDPTHSKAKVRAIEVKPLSRTADKLIVGLLWNALFGKSFKTIHWFLLFTVLAKTMKKDKSSLALMKILILSTGKPGQMNWMHNHSPCRRGLIQSFGQDRYQEELNRIVKSLPIMLPRKGPKIEELFAVDENSFIKQKKPTDPARIGVGYKDKGGLGTGSEDPLSGSVFLEREEVFDFLLRQAKSQLYGPTNIIKSIRK